MFPKKSEFFSFSVNFLQAVISADLISLSPSVCVQVCACDIHMACMYIWMHRWINTCLILVLFFHFFLSQTYTHCFEFILHTTFDWFLSFSYLRKLISFIVEVCTICFQKILNNNIILRSWLRNPGRNFCKDLKHNT